MNNFKLIQEHFTQLHCPYCDISFTQESVKLIREEDDYWVVKVSCTSCNQSAGIAIVGIEYEEIGFREARNTTKQHKELSPVEEMKFSSQPPISVNDVIDAHRFIQELGSDWMKYIRNS